MKSKYRKYLKTANKARATKKGQSIVEMKKAFMDSLLDSTEDKRFFRVGVPLTLSNGVPGYEFMDKNIEGERKSSLIGLYSVKTGEKLIEEDGYKIEWSKNIVVDKNTKKVIGRESTSHFLDAENGIMSVGLLSDIANASLDAADEVYGGIIQELEASENVARMGDKYLIDVTGNAKPVGKSQEKLSGKDKDDIVKTIILVAKDTSTFWTGTPLFLCSGKAGYMFMDKNEDGERDLNLMGIYSQETGEKLLEEDGYEIEWSGQPIVDKDTNKVIGMESTSHCLDGENGITSLENMAAFCRAHLNVFNENPKNIIKPVEYAANMYCSYLKMAS